jgi:beta-lactamase class A
VDYTGKMLVKGTEIENKGKGRKLILLLFVLTAVISGVMWWFREKGSQKADFWKGWTSIINFSVEKTPDEGDVSRETSNFVNSLQQKTQGQTGTYGIFVYRLKDKKWYGFNEDTIMPAASMMKVPAMIAVIKKIESGGMSWEDEYVLDDQDRRDGSGPIVNYPTGTKLTIRQLMEEMGKKSDNTALAALVRMMGKESVENAIKELGMENTSFEDTTTTARDMGLMWKKIYDGGVITPEDREVLWGFLQDSIYEDRLPAGLPDYLEVVHKVGTDVDLWSDTGIILGCQTGEVEKCPENFQPLVVAILSRDVNQAEAQDAYPILVKMIWSYEGGRKSS